MKPLPPEYSRFWRLWSQEEFFACHEELEMAWRREQSAERKQFFQGLIHCAVAIYQARRGNAIGACRQQARAEARLKPFLPNYLQVDLLAIQCQMQQELEPLHGALSLQQGEQLEKLKQRLKAHQSAAGKSGLAVGETNE